MLQDTLPYNKSHTNLNEAHVITPSMASHLSLSRPNSVASLTGLDMPAPDEGMSGPIATLMDVMKGGNVRTGALLNLIVISLLLFATISDVAFQKPTKATYYNEEADRETSYAPKDGSNRSNKLNNQKKGLLGSAMIQSVTEALSPILPFAGGVDLRRDQNWKSWSSWLTLWGGTRDYSTSNSPLNVEQVSSIPRGGGQNDEKKRRNKKRRMFQTNPTLSTSEPFLPTEDISQMTLREVASVFRYAVSSGAENMDKASFMKNDFLKLTDNSRMTTAIDAMEKATTDSRGKGVISAVTSHSENRVDKGPLSEINGYGDVDALQFCAAMRILAEWRVLRQVPPGFKGYAVGMNLGHKDVVQNIVKIESAVHEWIEKRSEDKSEKECMLNNEGETCFDGSVAWQPKSPTLRDLLQYEIDMDLHPTSRLPRLKDKTAAMGLLWVRRQLQYQTVIFSNIINVPGVFPTIMDAVGNAYSEVYGHLHGWTVQKIFNYSFQSAPDAEIIFRHMNPTKLEEVTSAARNGIVMSNANKKQDIQIESDIMTLSTVDKFLDIQGTPISQDRITFEPHHKDRGNPLASFFSHVGSEWDKLGKNIGGEVDKIGHHVGGEWDKIVCNLSRVLDNGNANDCKINNKKQMDTPRGGAKSKSPKGEEGNVVEMSGDELESYVSKEMAADARQHILSYLDIAVPLLDDLAGLFDEMNMDDPTKV